MSILWPHVLCLRCSNSQNTKAAQNVIKIGVILPLRGDYPWVIQAAFPAITLAAESVKFEILPGHQLELNIADSACSETVGPLAAIDMYINQSAHVFLGPACEYAIAPVARFSFYWGIPVLTAGAMVSAFSDKKEYKLLTRVQVRVVCPWLSSYMSVTLISSTENNVTVTKHRSFSVRHFSRVIAIGSFEKASN